MDHNFDGLRDLTLSRFERSGRIVDSEMVRYQWFQIDPSGSDEIQSVTVAEIIK